MKQKIATLLIIVILSLTTIPLANINGVNTSQLTNTIPDLQSALESRLSPQLLEKLKASADDGSREEPVKILVRHNQNVKVEMPEGVEVLKRFSLVPLLSVLSPLSKVEKICALPGVEYVYLDSKMKVASEEFSSLPYPDYSKIKEWKNAQVLDEEFPSDPWFGQYPAYLNETTELISARQLWAEGITGKNVTIAIIDTGINKYHPDLDDMDDNPTTHDPKILAEASFVPYETPGDLTGHGTHVASTAAGTGGTGAMDFYGMFPYYGIHNATILPGTEIGVAPGAYLYNAKAFDESGTADTSWIIEAIEWSVAQGADIISGSFGGWPDVSPDQDPIVLALKEAIEHGVVVVISAGNEGFGYFSVGTPGFAPDVITVGATSETDHLIFFSSRGPEEFGLHAKPDIVAPGTSVVAAFAFFREYEEYSGLQVFYLEASGTSMAAPHVSGAAALLLQAFPGASPYTVKAAMMQGADDLGLDAMGQGAGRLNVKKAYDIMMAAPKTQWAAPIPQGSVETKAPVVTESMNLEGKRILIEDSFCMSSEISRFVSTLETLGASTFTGFGPYSNSTLVDTGTGQPNYDVFIIPEPYDVDTVLLPPSVLEHYVLHNGTVLFIGDSPYLQAPKEYNVWTELWGITWNNTAVGGLSSHITSHNITNGISELYFGNPISSLIVNTGMNAQTVAWDPIFPGVAVWQTNAPAQGKVVVVSDDGLLDNEHVHSADNMQFGLNIIKWFTNPPQIKLNEVVSSVYFLPPLKSDHPYLPDLIQLYTITEAGAASIRVHFTRIEVETDADFVFVYDGDWNLVAEYTGIYSDVWTPFGNGDTLLIIFVSDSETELWGFEADMFQYKTLNLITSDYHDIAVGGTWPKYVIANTTAAIMVNVTNFGTYTENVTLSMNGVNVKNVTNLAPNASETVDLSNKFNATLFCDRSGVNMTTIGIRGSILDSELDYTNNGFSADIAAVPKAERKGDNPLLSVLTPMKIGSTSAPLIAMYPEDFTLHNLTAFVGGGQLIDAKFQIVGNISIIADFVNVNEFAYHALVSTAWGMLPDPSPVYFMPNTTAVVGDAVLIGDISAPTMLFAELQVYIPENAAVGTYSGTVDLLNGTTMLASADLSFEVKKPMSRILLEDYYNDYNSYWIDCERLWGGAAYSYGLFEWWKLASQAGFDVDSLHQQVYFSRHTGYLGPNSTDPLGIIAHGDYDTLFMQDTDFSFRPYELAVFKQLYESGRMNFLVAFDGGSETVSNFTKNYGIDISDYIFDLVITEFDKAHPIFSDVENFTLFTGPVFTVQSPSETESVTMGIATGTDDWGVYWPSGFVMATNEMHATSHLTSRMVAVSDSNTFEFLEYAKFMAWYNVLINTGISEAVSRVDTDKVAVNMLEWLNPQFANKPPIIDYYDVTPATAKLAGTVNVDVVAHDPDSDNFDVTIAVLKPNSTWDNATVSSEGGHWLRSFTADLEGTYTVYAVATDYYGAKTTVIVGSSEIVNLAPRIVSQSISPNKITEGEVVFITVSGEDPEDLTLVEITLNIVDPDGLRINYTFFNTTIANVAFSTSDKTQGVYQVEANIKDSNGKIASVTVGSFEIEPAPFPTETAILGLGLAVLIALAIALLLIYKRLPAAPAPTLIPEVPQ